MSKREMKRKQQLKTARRKQIIRIAAILGGALILLFAVILPLIRNSSSATNNNILMPPTVERPMVNENGLGNPNAPVKTINFSSYRCSHCLNFAMNKLPNTLSEEEIINDYVSSGKVYFSYLPISWSPETPNSAEEATYCAMDQGKFWEYRDIIFTNLENPNIEAIDTDMLVTFAEMLGLDMDAFNKCFDEHKYLQRISDDLILAEEAGLIGTPSFLVNDTLVFSNELISTIEAELAR